MSRIRGFVLDLYCDNLDCPTRRKPSRYTAQTIREAVRDAREDGWVTSKKRDLCPACAPAARQIPMPTKGDVW